MSVKGKQTAWQVPRFLSFPRVPATLCSPVVFACFAKGVVNRDRQVAVHGEGVMVEVMGPADRSRLRTQAEQPRGLGLNLSLPLTGRVAGAGSSPLPRQHSRKMRRPCRPSAVRSHRAPAGQVRRTEPAPPSFLGIRFVPTAVLLLGARFLAVCLEMILTHRRGPGPCYVPT